MKYFSNYSILRFLPYPETGEFVNIGVVLFCSNGDFLYKIEHKRRRVTNFFHMLDANIYIRARNEMELELARLSSFFTKNKGDKELTINAFKHLTHPRETMMRFSAPSTLAVGNPAQALNEIFDHYVNLSFAGKEYEEKNLEKQLGRLLEVSNLKNLYKNEKLGSLDYSVRFPFIYLNEGTAIQAIKALHLAHDEPSKILEHGDTWISRVRRLKRANKLADDMLFITSSPSLDHKKLYSAYSEIVTSLKDNGIRVIDKSDSEVFIIEKIREGLPSQLH